MMCKLEVQRWGRASRPEPAELVEDHPAGKLMSIPARLCFMKHSHATDEIRVLMEGRMKFGAAGREVTLFPGDKVIIPANMPHWAEAVEASRLLALASGGI